MLEDSTVVDKSQEMVAAKSLRVDTFLKYEPQTSQKASVEITPTTLGIVSKSNSSVITNKSNHSDREKSIKVKGTGPNKVRKQRRMLRILLVDDSLAILKMTHSTLEKMGHQVVSAKNGARGLAEMQRLVLDNLNGVPDLERGRGGVGLDLVLMDLQVKKLDL